MSFREKTAWVTLIALVLVSLMYWFHVPSPFEPHPQRWVMLALGISISTFLIIEAIARLALFLRSPKEARAPKDEREQLISLKATRVASWVFTAGAFAAIFAVLHLTRYGAVAIAMSVVIAFVLAQLARNVAIIVYYRRGV